jgi:surface protein
MFYNASSFSNHDLSDWKVSNVTNHDDFLSDAGSGNIEPNWP